MSQGERQRGESALKKAQSTTGGAADVEWASPREHTFWLYSEQEGTKKVKGQQKEGPCKGPAVRPTLAIAGSSRWEPRLMELAEGNKKYRLCVPSQCIIPQDCLPAYLLPDLFSYSPSTKSRLQSQVGWPRAAPGQAVSD